jgi:hypothetical protein
MSLLPSVLIILLVVLRPTIANGQVVLAENAIYGGYVDSSDLGQSFTVADNISISKVDLNVAAVNGGAGFTVYISSYDPWNHIHGERLCEKFVDGVGFGEYPNGSWIAVDFDETVDLSPGIYSINIDTHSNGAPGGYNRYAVTSTNVFVGGRRILAPGNGNYYTNHHDLAFRIYGMGSPQSLIPPVPKVPRLQVDGISTRTWTTSKFLDYTHDTVAGIVYFCHYSFDLKTWDVSDGSTLGGGGSHSGLVSDLGYGRVFIRIESVNLGDTVGRKR